MLQHECVGTDLGQSRLSCLQLFTEVSTFVVTFLHSCMTDIRADVLLCHFDVTVSFAAEFESFVKQYGSLILPK